MSGHSSVVYIFINLIAATEPLTVGNKPVLHTCNLSDASLKPITKLCDYTASFFFRHTLTSPSVDFNSGVKLAARLIRRPQSHFLGPMERNITYLRLKPNQDQPKITKKIFTPHNQTIMLILNTPLAHALNKLIYF